ncbi:phage tail family protein [Staphylococcus lugdunensis]|uniref:phage tail domain-containing protein n=1 Tax=Staphylococcus lugdunensis TaxID=28035 RepID=UPI0012458826|nr:phage tail domain-containing protein [Staphylococcus lugdunensis]MCH8673940.1 phage tail family protein [Staphylococcus lugdunensis]MDU3707045.1 phage tail family protein [Staphylococcus lugdunensis]QEX32047.1 phage tail protein [Staphylococcus lugdunensis]UZW83610.1 phage tail family protein [Staphylococcus lugdunensis]UZW89857.1 phage tail family protein [Staphylococcus lugdunensis]
MIAHDVEIIKDKNKYKISDNPFTQKALEVVSFDVEGAGYSREFEKIERVNGRFYNSTNEELKKVSLKVRYKVSKMAYASHLKTGLQNLLSGHYYLRELATPNPEIKFESLFSHKTQDFELEYVDGRQIFVGLVNSISIDTTKLTGEIDIEFETVDLPYFESIAYSTDLEKDPNMEKWAVPDDLPFNKSESERRFTFYNTMYDFVTYDGDVPINQFNQKSIVEIKVGERVKKTQEFTFYTEHSDIARIKGIEIKPGDVIKFDGLHTYRNNLRIDKYNITQQQPVLYPGSNYFRANVPMQKITFKHKLYFR